MAVSEVSSIDHATDAGLNPNQVPRHVAIIMDGNGRWATQRGLPRIEGHRNGVKSVRRITEEACRLGIEQLTLYCLSIENWKRPKAELELLMVLLEQFLVEERPTLHRNNVRLTFIGRREGLPASALAALDRTMAETAEHTGLTLCLAINYGGRTELVDAVRRIAEEIQTGRILVDEIDENLIERRLYTQGMPEPDLLIRTAGEHRVSNFLLWQISYAEIWITEAFWPDFEIAEFHRAIRDFSQRERRFGGLNSP